MKYIRRYLVGREKGLLVLIFEVGIRFVTSWNSSVYSAAYILNVVCVVTLIIVRVKGRKSSVDC